MIRALLLIVAVIFAVCVAAQWGVGHLTPFQELGVSVACFEAAFVVPDVTVTQVRQVVDRKDV